MNQHRLLLVIFGLRFTLSLKSQFSATDVSDLVTPAVDVTKPLLALVAVVSMTTLLAYLRYYVQQLPQKSRFR